ncbi:hypothetical protein ZONE111904_04370 [Zobellia nedashkovskayae]
MGNFKIKLDWIIIPIMVHFCTVDGFSYSFTLQTYFYNPYFLDNNIYWFLIIYGLNFYTEKQKESSSDDIYIGDQLYFNSCIPYFFLLAKKKNIYKSQKWQPCIFLQIGKILKACRIQFNNLKVVLCLTDCFKSEKFKNVSYLNQQGNHPITNFLYNNIIPIKILPVQTLHKAVIKL